MLCIPRKGQSEQNVTPDGSNNFLSFFILNIFYMTSLQPPVPSFLLQYTTRIVPGNVLGAQCADLHLQDLAHL